MSQRKCPVLGKRIALSRESNGHDAVNLHHRSVSCREHATSCRYQEDGKLTVDLSGDRGLYRPSLAPIPTAVPGARTSVFSPLVFFSCLKP